MSSSIINVAGDRDGRGPKFLAQMNAKETKAICERRRRDFDGRADRARDGWMDGCGLIRGPDGSLCGFTAAVLVVKQQRDSLSKFFW